MDEKTLIETEARLKLWSTEIERRAAALGHDGGRVRFAALQHVDELKVLHAIALARFDALRSDAGGNRSAAEAELTVACNELAAAVSLPMPRP